MVGAQARVGEGDRGQAGVPHRGLAGLDHPGAVLAPHREAVQGFQSGAHHGVPEVVAEQVQGDDGVHGGRLDPAPAAVVLLALDDPAACGGHGGLAQPARREPPVDVQGLVHPLEDALPAGRRGGALGGVRHPCVGVQFVEGEGGRADRAQRGDHGERDDGLAGPAAEVVDVQGHPGRQEHQLGREFGQVVPVPPAEERQPDPGEDAGGGDPAVGPDPGRGTGHVRGVRRVPGEAERDVGLDGGGQFGRAAVEGGPGAVLPLLAADEQGRGVGGGLVPDAEELPQQQVLRVHGDVGLQVALPPALGVLTLQQVPGRPRGGLVHARRCAFRWLRQVRGAPVRSRPVRARGRVREHAHAYAATVLARRVGLRGEVGPCGARQPRRARPVPDRAHAHPAAVRSGRAARAVVGPRAGGAGRGSVLGLQAGPACARRGRGPRFGGRAAGVPHGGGRRETRG